MHKVSLQCCLVTSLLFLSHGVRRVKLVRGEGTAPVLLVALRAGRAGSSCCGAGAGPRGWRGSSPALQLSPHPREAPSPPEAGLDPWVQGMSSRAELSHSWVLG